MDDDRYDIKSLKKFLKGSNDYRNKHFCILPNILDAPRLVKFMIPKNHNIYLTGSWLPLSWKQRNAEKNYAPVLEMTCDVVTNALLRQVSSLVKRYCSSISLDVAFVLHDEEDEDLTEEEKGKNCACLQMIQMGNVDLASCPIIPPITESMDMKLADAIHKQSLVLATT